MAKGRGSRWTNAGHESANETYERPSGLQFNAPSLDDGPCNTYFGPTPPIDSARKVVATPSHNHGKADAVNLLKRFSSKGGKK